jgi:DNA-binding response OmpR family regulator
MKHTLTIQARRAGSSSLHRRTSEDDDTVTIVLYVEDDNEHALLVSNMLTSRGYRVETAVDGYDGLEKARTLQPHVILLDLLLPRLDGFGVMKCLQEDATTEQIPVIVISAWPTTDNRKRVRKAGALGFITKPFKAEELEAAIQEALGAPQSPTMQTGG